MYRKRINILIASLLSLVFVMGATPVHAVDLINVVEIIDPAPFIIHTNILPGDVFMDKMTVQNLTSSPQEVLMNLDIDLTEGIVNIVPFELEEKLTTRIERVGSGDITLPGGGTVKKLQELDDTLINLGTIAGNSEQEYRIHVTFDSNAGNEYQNTKVYFNITMGLEIDEIRGSLRIVKTNDSVSDEVPGNDVVYTLQVTVLGGDVDDVTVTDLPPEGFEYVAGSGTGAPFVHEYASPGIWDLGDMEEGETKTLTYRTRIRNTQDAGLYRDLAFARGVAAGTPILANSAENPFVGTEVNVVLNDVPIVTVEEDNENKRVEKIKKKTQYVLGASTLPMTGADIRVLVLALGGIILGGGLIFLARRRRLPVALLALFFLGGFLFTSEIALAGNLSVRIETPDVQVPGPNFKIGFVTLDVLGRALTVECYKDADVTPFATYTLVSSFGGNSGDCQINATVLPVDGDYEFYVKAIATDEGSETVESSHVNVRLASVIPGTPYNYDRDDSSCMNNISFTTANDGGKTVKVELYRSLSTTFVADASTFVSDQAISSNVSGAFAIPAPGCSNDYHYALRAVEIHGNGSGFVGDKDVNVDTHTVTRTRTTTVTLPGTVTGALATATGDGIGSGAVQGAETVQGETGAEGEQLVGSVLGEMSEIDQVYEDAKNWMDRYWGWVAFLALVLAGFLYQRYRTHQRKTHEPLP